MMCVNPFVWLTYQNRALVTAGAKWLPPAYVFVGVALLISTLLFQRTHRILRAAVYWQRVPRLWRWMNDFTIGWYKMPVEPSSAAAPMDSGAGCGTGN